MKTIVYLTRHGQTEWNIEKRLQGQGNSSLTKAGIERAMELAERVKDLNIDRIYSSTLERAFHTANIIRGEQSIEIIKNDNLVEMGFGEYEGRITDEIKLENPEWDIELIMKGNTTIAAPNGETLAQVRDRVKVAMDSIIEENKGKKILVVAHGITLKALMFYFNDEEVNSEVMGQATLTKVIVDKNNEFKIEFKNDDSHFTVKEAKLGW